MSIDLHKVQNFFTDSFYLDRCQHVIEVRQLIIREFLGDRNYANALDLGCGDGSISIPLISRFHHLTGVDLTPRMLQLFADRVPKTEKQKVVLLNQSVDDFQTRERYDLVFCIGLLAHVPSIESVLKKISNVLASEGFVVVEFAPNPEPLRWLFFPYYALKNLISGQPQGYRTNRMSLADLIAMAEANGLRFVTQRRHSFPIPTMTYWPKSWLRKFTIATLRWPLLSRIGIEYVILFERQADV